MSVSGCNDRKIFCLFLIDNTRQTRKGNDPEYSASSNVLICQFYVLTININTQVFEEMYHSIKYIFSHFCLIIYNLVTCQKKIHFSMMIHCSKVK
jgi:hypothetical protein